jgi:hypothetical protein
MAFPLPTLACEVAFTTAPGAVPTWTDVTSSLRGFTINRGRQYELGRFEAGTATVRLDNRTRAFDPTYATGPYYPNVLPMKKIRLSATYSAVTYRLFTGFVDGWPQSWPGSKDGVVEVPATDGFKVLSLTKITGILKAITGAEDNGAGLIRVTAIGHTLVTGAVVSIYGVVGTTEANATWTVTVIDDDTLDLQGSTFTNEYVAGGTVATYGTQRTDQRVTSILDAAAWPAADRSLDTGISTVQPSALDKVDALSHLQLVELSENGRLYIKGDGVLRFENRHSAYLTTSQFTFTGAHYHDPVADYDDTQIWNEVTVTRAAEPVPDGRLAPLDPTPQIQEDATSQTAYLIRSLDRAGVIFENDNEAHDAAEFLLANYKDPALRISAISVSPAKIPATLWPQVLGREIGERVTVTIVPPGGGATIIQHSFIEGINLEYAASPRHFDATYRLSAIGIGYQVYGAGKSIFTVGTSALTSGTGVLVY